MINLKINGRALAVPPGTTILEAAAQLGLEIPHYCYHPDIGIDGNCRMCLVQVGDDVQKGDSLATALSRYPEAFGDVFVSLVQTGEVSGTLDDVLEHTARYLERAEVLRLKVEAALRYPTFVVMAMVGALVIVNLVVIPAFAKLFAGYKAQLPLMTRIVIGVSDFTVAWWPVLLALVVGAIVAFNFWRRTPSGKYAWDRFKLRIPVAGSIINKATLARFARSFALSTKSGVPVGGR